MEPALISRILVDVAYANEPCPGNGSCQSYIALGRSRIAHCLNCSSRVRQTLRFFAERIAQREHDEWAQRKWFDLYLEAAEALDTVDYFRAKYSNAEYKQGTQEMAKDWNEMMLKVRAVGRTAFVFPQNPIVTAFIASCKFRDSERAVSDEHYKEMFEAVEGLRAGVEFRPFLTTILCENREPSQNS